MLPPTDVLELIARNALAALYGLPEHYPTCGTDVKLSCAGKWLSHRRTCVCERLWGSRLS